MYTRGFWHNKDGEVSSLKPILKSLFGGVVAAAGLAFAFSGALAQQPGFSSQFQAEHHGPVNITGETFVYDYKTDSFVVTGNAVVTQANTTLTAHQIELERRHNIMHAIGDVHLVDPLGEITASKARINLDNETANLTDATVTDSHKNYRLQGKQITKRTGQRYSVQDGFFTTCGQEEGTPDWSITAQQMNVDIGDEGHARNAHFNVLGYPVLYLPYAVFPANTQRHSGFLSPRIGTSGLRGFQLLQPYYLDINKSSDATAALDVETSQRVGALAEYRLVSGLGNYLSIDGSFYDEHLRSEESRIDDVIDNQIADTHIPVNRYSIIAMGRQHLTSDLIAYGDAISVSDSLFLREMDVWTLSRGIGSTSYPGNFASMRNALSDFGLLYRYNNGFARFDGTWNQDLIQPQQFALQTLPELLVSGRKELFGGLAYTDYDLQGVNFWRSDGTQGLRFDLDPRFTVPWRLGNYLYGFGTLGLRETLYDTSGHQVTVIPVGTEGRRWNNNLKLGPLAPGGFQSREMIYGTAGVATEIQRVYDLNWKYISKLKHTITPYVTYSYVPQVDQSNLPLFDSTDRMEARSLFTYGFTTRLFGKLPALPKAEQSDESTPLRPQMTVASSSVEELMQLNVVQAYDTDHAIAKGATRFSDLQATANFFPTSIISLGSQLGYSPTQSQVRYASTFINFQPWWINNKPSLYMGKAEEGSFLQLSYNYIGPGPSVQPGVNANFSEFLVLRAYYDLFDRLGVYFAPSYDFATHRMLAAQYGVRIKAPCGCWAFDVGITKTINPSETQFQFQLTLGGIGSVGQSPFGRNPFQLHESMLPYYW